ncbi:MAG: TadE family type IV pilus minor pilin [Jatrophihabitans sp.]
MVTAELAAALPVLVLLVFAGVSAVHVVDARVRCLDAAREAVRAAARGDPRAVSLARSVAPPGAQITVRGGAGSGSGQVSATVSVVVHPLGVGVAAATVRETAVGVAEPAEIGSPGDAVAAEGPGPVRTGPAERAPPGQATARGRLT